MPETLLSQTRRVRKKLSDEEARKRRAREANIQPVVAGGAGSGMRQRTGDVASTDVRNMRRQLNDAIAAKDAKKLTAIAQSAQRWMERGASAPNKSEVSEILNTARRLATRYGTR